MIDQLTKNIMELFKTTKGKIIFGASALVIIIIVIIIIVVTIRFPYDQIEDKLIGAAKSYYSDNSKKLPQKNNETVSINSDKLVKEGYIKDIDKLSKNKNDNCIGQVTVSKNDDNLYYSVNLSCKNYKTKKLKDVILENVVTSEDGLYQIGNDYVFRGEKVNNYIIVGGYLWKILRVNQDGTIRAIEFENIMDRDVTEWDDRYNSVTEYESGINDYKISRIKDTLADIYKFYEKANMYMIKQNLCIGKRAEEETNNDGSVECSEIFPDQNLGLIQVNEYALASISPECKNPTGRECQNYNWLRDLHTWTITANSETTEKVYELVGTTVHSMNAAASAEVKPVALLNSQLNYVSGDGTKENPYKFK